MKVMTLDEIRSLAKDAKGEIDKIYLHWTAGPYGIPFRDYHFYVDDDGTIYCMCEALTEKKKASVGNYGNWDSTKKHLQAYDPKGVSFERLDKDWLEGFKDYLDNVAITKTGEPISLNTKYSYFNKVRAALKQALKETKVI